MNTCLILLTHYIAAIILRPDKYNSMFPWDRDQKIWGKNAKTKISTRQQSVQHLLSGQHIQHQICKSQQKVWYSNNGLIIGLFEYWTRNCCLHEIFWSGLEMSTIVLLRPPLKASPANPRTYTLSVLKCNCRYYNAIVGTILKNRDLQHWGRKK